MHLELPSWVLKGALQERCSCDISAPMGRRGGPKGFFRRISLPVTIVLVPHSYRPPLRINLPVSLLLFGVFAFFLSLSIALLKSVRTVEYERMKREYRNMSSQFVELRSTIASLKRTEVELKRLLSLSGREKVFEEVKEEPPGSLDVELLRKETENAIESIIDLKIFLREQRALFLATPKGWPVVGGQVTSGFGKRVHPLTKEFSFHTGVDISVPAGTHVVATADGIVSYSGWSYESGYTVVLEHGHGFSTVYAHNKKNLVKVGQRVRRGETIALSGDTGSLTGPHLHYEVWKERKPVDPEKYMEERFVEKRQNP